MAQFNDMAKLDGNFKTAYGDSILDLLPDFAITQKTIKFAPASQTPGKKFAQPVILADEQGVTYVAANGGVVTLEDSVAGQVSFAEVQGSNVYLRSSLDYEAAAAAASSINAFVGATAHLVKRMAKTATKRLEIASLYGGVGLGTIATVSDSTGTNTLTLTAATWAGGIWAGMEGAKLDAYTSGGTKVNTNATLVLSSITFSSRTLVVTGNSTDTAALAATNVLFFRGSYGNEMLGLQYITTRSGTLFNIDNSVYSAFRGNSYAVGGALSMAKVLAAADLAVLRGLMGDCTLYVNPSVWTTLNVDQAALRRYDYGYKGEKGAENGYEAIIYHYSGGKIQIVAHPMVKVGDGFLFQPKSLKYIGTTKFTFELPGNPGRIFLHLADKNGIEFRGIANMALFAEEPAHMVYLSGITA